MIKHIQIYRCINSKELIEAIKYFKLNDIYLKVADESNYPFLIGIKSNGSMKFMEEYKLSKFPDYNEYSDYIVDWKDKDNLYKNTYSEDLYKKLGMEVIDE